MTFRTTKLSEARECLLISRKNTPATKGKHVGGGIHVPMPDMWDEQSDEVPLGWSGVALSVDEEKQEYAVHIDDTVEHVKGADLVRLRHFKSLAVPDTTTVEQSPPIKTKERQ